MDSIDKRILKLLQEDASLPLAELSERVGLSQTPCWRRIQKLKDSGVIRKQVTLLDPARINLGVTVFVAVRTSEHTPQWLDRFAKGVADIPEVLELYRMSGDVDYLLRVVVPDIAGYDAVYKKLIKAANLHDVSSSFAMECIKYTTELPLVHAPAQR
jgi:Lrp/AsnC family transcriptional regulator